MTVEEVRKTHFYFFYSLGTVTQKSSNPREEVFTAYLVILPRVFFLLLTVLRVLSIFYCFTSFSLQYSL